MPQGEQCVKRKTHAPSFILQQAVASQSAYLFNSPSVYAYDFHSMPIVFFCTLLTFPSHGSQTLFFVQIQTLAPEV